MEAKALRNLHYQGERILTKDKIYQGNFIDEPSPGQPEYTGMFHALDDQGTPICFIIGLDVELILNEIANGH